MLLLSHQRNLDTWHSNHHGKHGILYPTAALCTAKQ